MNQEHLDHIVNHRFDQAHAKNPITQPATYKAAITRRLLEDETTTPGFIATEYARLTGTNKTKRTTSSTASGPEASDLDQAISLALHLADRGSFSDAEIISILEEDHDRHIAELAIQRIRTSHYRIRNLETPPPTPADHPTTEPYPRGKLPIAFTDKPPTREPPNRTPIPHITPTPPIDTALPEWLQDIA